VLGFSISKDNAMLSDSKIKKGPLSIKSIFSVKNTIFSVKSHIFECGERSGNFKSFPNVVEIPIRSIRKIRKFVDKTFVKVHPKASVNNRMKW
jgi:predicted NUDIX family NTP pyrophosphohydrolase